MDRLGMLDCVVLRLSNVYGPRMALAVDGQGFLVTYLNRLVRGMGLEVYGDGSQLRDPVHINDVVDAFLLAGSLRQAERRKVFNIAGPAALTLRQIAEISARASGGVPVTLRAFPADRKPIDIGSFHADLRRARQAFGWTPRIRFEEGIASTLAYYAAHAAHYLPGVPLPPGSAVNSGEPRTACDAA
jgi:UDP-glucose 4-epimerase